MQKETKGHVNMPAATFWATLRSRLRNRPDTEHQQILIRLIVANIVIFILGMVVAFGKYLRPKHRDSGNSVYYYRVCYVWLSCLDSHKSRG